MKNNSRVKRFVAIGAIAASSIAAVAPTLTSAAGTGTDAVTKTTTPATTTTTTSKTTPTTTTTVKSTTTTIKGKVKSPSNAAVVTNKYEVVAGIFATRTQARAKISALKKAGFRKFTIKPIGNKFAVVEASLTKTQATNLAKQINKVAALGPAHIKKLV